MHEAAAAMARAASGRSGVLVRGENGTGRALAAQAIHAAGEATRAGRFIAVDCAALEGRLEQELFGTTTRSEEEGLPARGFERITSGSLLHAAIGGTLFLENVHEASTRVQRRLVRALRDREIVVNDGSSLPFDVRCMAGADDSFSTAVSDGRVEETLSRRLSSVRVDLPSLRNRREDIPALANRFLRDACVSQQLPVKMLSRSALALLTALPWRGNVAELRALMANLAGRASRGVGVEDVLSLVRLDSGSTAMSQSGTLRQARAQFEHEYIATILRQHRGRITQAAKTLGIQRTNLYRKMRTLKVAQPRMR
jgi:DNA-binding NtrC family response regulator